MATFHDDMRDLAIDLIGEFGSQQSASFSRSGSTGFNPITGEETATIPITATALVVVPPETDQSREEARAQGWDVRFLVPAGFEPQVGDLVTLPGRSGNFSVIAPVEMVAPDGDPIYFVVRARRG